MFVAGVLSIASARAPAQSLRLQLPARTPESFAAYESVAPPAAVAVAPVPTGCAMLVHDRNNPLATPRRLYLAESARGISAIWDLISETPTGRAVADQFLLGERRGIFSVAEISEDEQNGRGVLAYHDPRTHTVHFNPRMELGILAIVFVHEVTHALDPKSEARYQLAVIRTNARQRRLPASEDDLLLRQFNALTLETERKAYDAHRHFTDELASVLPCTHDYFEHESNPRQRPWNPTDNSEIWRRYTHRE